MDGGREGWMARHPVGRVDGWGGQMDRQTDGRMDRQMDRFTALF